ncbi:MAG TPA: response regulator transcription factor, partial [Thermomicrobiales bacterium]|nr:response regulator transcription factor [Thermomicrobiales bacterium]
RHLIEQFVRNRVGIPTPTAIDLSPLTDRERDVLELVAGGLTNTEIADALFITIATAKTHVSNILAKLRARDRAQLVIIAYESGLVLPGQ